MENAKILVEAHEGGESRFMGQEGGKFTWTGSADCSVGWVVVL